jgi:hypothetical protein
VVGDIALDYRSDGKKLYTCNRGGQIVELDSQSEVILVIIEVKESICDVISVSWRHYSGANSPGDMVHKHPSPVHYSTNFP